MTSEKPSRCSGVGMISLTSRYQGAGILSGYRKSVGAGMKSIPGQNRPNVPTDRGICMAEVSLLQALGHRSDAPSVPADEKSG
jgi:hypothetical protein